jgi:dephospho-CoA kinase
MIIGIIGKKHSGKDTLADYIVSKYKFKKKSFAYPLKKTCSYLFNIPFHYFENQELKEKMIEEWEMSPRQIMQKVGTDMFRHQIEDTFWIRHLFHDINVQSNIVITDIRFLNEIIMVQKYNGILIYIERNNNICKDEHESENQDLIKYADFYLQNNSSINDFIELFEYKCHNIVKLFATCHDDSF